MLKLILSAFTANIIVWFYAILSPQTTTLVKKYFNISISESVLWPPLIFLPLIYLLNLCYAYAFKIGPKMGVSVLFVSLMMVITNVIVFAAGEWLLFKKVSMGDLFFVVMILIGLAGRYYLLNR